MTNYVYLLREREFIKTKEHVYKIGKTRQTPKKRLAGYPKGSEVLMFVEVKNCDTTEKLIIKTFISRFKCRRDIGTEYFEGDRDTIVDVFNQCASGKIVDVHPKVEPTTILENYKKNFIVGLGVIFGGK